jgi:hypothetical protein
MRGNRWWLGTGLVLALTGMNMAQAAEAEVRHFNVIIDKKPAGTYSLTINRRDDGSMAVAAQAAVNVRYLVFKYSYTLRGTEVWKDGRLVQLDSTCNDDGKQYTVAVRPNGNGLDVQVNGQVRQTRGDVWVTTYWCLPAPNFRNQAVPLLDADTGKDIPGRLHFVAQVQLSVAGQVQNCSHYRVTGGGLQVDLWYDGQERMVRQEAVEDGHRTVLELVRIER